MLLRARLSRIYYRKKFFHYALEPLNALKGLGIYESVLVLLSYLRWQLAPYRREKRSKNASPSDLEEAFFRPSSNPISEKVWGISCSELNAEWAAQRIKNLSLRWILVHMFLKPGNKIRSLIEEFHYPRFGPGMMWNAVRQRVQERGGVCFLNAEVIKVQHHRNRLNAVVILKDGLETTVKGTDFISSMPITEFVHKLDPPPPSQVLRAAAKLRYRDFVTVCLVISNPNLFPDNWIYIHDPQVKVGRIQNFKNWSSSMVPDPTKTGLGLEYFCNEGDDFWTMSDTELIDLAKKELAQIGLARPDEVLDGCVFRVPKAYPVYDVEYREHLATVKEYVTGLENFQTIGRNGLHRYNNQDHAMLTGILAARNLALGERNDLWNVNGDAEYHEEMSRTDSPVGREFPEDLSLRKNPSLIVSETNPRPKASSIFDSSPQIKFEKCGAVSAIGVSESPGEFRVNTLQMDIRHETT